MHNCSEASIYQIQLHSIFIRIQSKIICHVKEVSFCCKFTADFFYSLFIYYSPSKIAKYYYVLAQSWPRALKFHDSIIGHNVELKPINHWILHGLYVNSSEENLLKKSYPKSPDYQSPKDKRCVLKLHQIMPNVIKGKFTKGDD